MRSLLALLLGLLTTATGAQSVSGAGATFPFPVYAKWASRYAQETGVKVNYQAIGSGGGIKQIIAGTVDFGATDMPLARGKLDALELVQFPMVIGGVVVAYNLPSVPSGRLRLTGPVLADIFLGRIRRWNDERIAELNKGIDLPRDRITVVHRSDGSGTTFNFAHYLAKVSAPWADDVGVSTALRWPTGIGGKGNEGVANYVKQVRGAIGYVEFAHALRSGLSVAMLRNQSGNFVAPSIETFAAAAEFADWSEADQFDLVLTHQPGEAAWPITAATFILMRRDARREDAARAAVTFFDWAYRHGDQAAEELHYVPVPASVRARVREVWAEAFVEASGGPIYGRGQSAP